MGRLLSLTACSQVTRARSRATIFLIEDEAPQAAALIAAIFPTPARRI